MVDVNSCSDLGRFRDPPSILVCPRLYARLLRTLYKLDLLQDFRADYLIVPCGGYTKANCSSALKIAVKRFPSAWYTRTSRDVIGGRWSRLVKNVRVYVTRENATATLIRFHSRNTFHASDILLANTVTLN